MATIHSRKFWNPTGIHIEYGKRYRYSAVGTWKDASILCDANGWSDVWRWGWAECFKRCPEADWFQLVGSIEKISNPIVLGTGGTFVAPATGELYCYANDGLLAYGNNSGAIELMIEPYSASVAAVSLAGGELR